jgi:hypothetical protein
VEKMYVGTNLSDDRNAMLPRLVWQVVRVAERRRSREERRAAEEVDVMYVVLIVEKPRRAMLQMI